MQISERTFGVLPGDRPVKEFTLKTKDIEVSIIEYGCIITKLYTADGEGHLGNIVLGYNELSSYLSDQFYIGRLIGRVANRISNSCFELSGQTYKLSANHGKHHLHGGDGGVSHALWQGSIRSDGNVLTLSYHSPAGEAGYPGTVDISMQVSVPKPNELVFQYMATSDQETPLDLTRHDYFNLSAGMKNDILDHTICVPADQITIQGEDVLPTGEVQHIAGSVFDLTESVTIGQQIKQYPVQLRNGYDQNYVLRSTTDDLKLAAELSDPESGRSLQVLTTQPCVMLYTGGYLTSKSSGYGEYSGLCLEAQQFPNSLNRPEFMTSLVAPRRPYQHKLVYRFS
ncbi:MAG: galactose mutarotase [Aquisalinus sp.]|nr:galactose mutarotase [Aquisalinus sp.]